MPVRRPVVASDLPWFRRRGCAPTHPAIWPSASSRTLAPKACFLISVRQETRLDDVVAGRDDQRNGILDRSR